MCMTRKEVVVKAYLPDIKKLTDDGKPVGMCEGWTKSFVFTGNWKVCEGCLSVEIMYNGYSLISGGYINKWWWTSITRIPPIFQKNTRTMYITEDCISITETFYNTCNCIQAPVAKLD